jgi:CDP-glycerol glycerophosphotransferase
MAEYIHEKYGNKYEIVFFYEDKSLIDKVNLTWIKWIKFNSIEYCIFLASSKYIVSNITIPSFIPYRKNQIKLCTWHGAAFKGNRPNVFNYNIFDFFVVENELTYNAVRDDFLYESAILRTGMPRNDCLVNPGLLSRRRIREKFNLSQNTKMLLYAPTVRDNGEDDCYLINFEKLKKTLKNKFGSDWKIAFRYHPLQKKRNLPEECIDLSNYDDMQEILLCTDILITDYSSCMWDFSLLGKPCFIYASDIDRYINDERGDFFYPIEELPFPLARCEGELENNIMQFETDKYQRNVRKYHEECGRYNTRGDATEKVVNILFTE